jgi:hypothetical protein
MDRHIARRSRRVAAAILLVTALSGCATQPPASGDGLHAYLQQVGEGGILPSPTREIGEMESVVWLNASSDRAITVILEKASSEEVGCTTSQGFRPVAGPSAVTGLLPPGASASLCFHRSGTYAYEVRGLDRPLRGTIVVRDARAPDSRATPIR